MKRHNEVIAETRALFKDSPQLSKFEDLLSLLDTRTLEEINKLVSLQKGLSQ